MHLTSEILQFGMMIIILLFMWIYARVNKASLREMKESIGELSGQLNRSPSESTSSPELLEAIKKYDGHFSILAKELREYHRVSEILTAKIAESTSRQDGMLGGIRDYLATKNELTGRLQEGYDYRILRNFVKQIIRCIHQIDSNLSLDSGQDPVLKLEAIKGDLLDMLDRHGIEKITPTAGTSFSELRKIAEVVPQKEETQDESLSGKIAEVIHPGYQYMINHDHHRIIMPAQVKLYEVTRRK